VAGRPAGPDEEVLAVEPVGHGPKPLHPPDEDVPARVGLPALEGAGGLLLLLVSLQLLTGHAEEPTSTQRAKANVAFVPLGTPLLAGPGAIVATMLFVRRAHGARDYLAIALGMLIVLLLVWLVLRFSGFIVRVLRPAGIEVVTRIAGLLVAAIAVQLIADAVGAFVTAYRS